MCVWVVSFARSKNVQNSFVHHPSRRCSVRPRPLAAPPLRLSHVFRTAAPHRQRRRIATLLPRVAHWRRPPARARRRASFVRIRGPFVSLSVCVRACAAGKRKIHKGGLCVRRNMQAENVASPCAKVVCVCVCVLVSVLHSSNVQGPAARPPHARVRDCSPVCIQSYFCVAHSGAPLPGPPCRCVDSLYRRHPRGAPCRKPSEEGERSRLAAPIGRQAPQVRGLHPARKRRGGGMGAIQQQQQQQRSSVGARVIHIGVVCSKVCIAFSSTQISGGRRMVITLAARR